MEIIAKPVTAPVIWSESLAFLKNQLCEKTRKDYRNDLAAFIRFVSKNALAVTPHDIIAYKEALESKGLAPATIHKRLAVVRSFYKFLSQTLNVPNPALCVKLPKVSDESTRAVLSLQETIRLIEAIPKDSVIGKRDRAVVGLLAICGLRSVECSRANVGDIHVVDGFTVMRVIGKGNRIGQTKLREDVRKAIQAYLETRSEAKPDQPLFLSIGNLARGRMSAKTIQARMKHYMTKAGVLKPNTSCHSLRHGCAIHTLSVGGADIVKVQRMLRHANIAVTTRYLTALDTLRDNGVDYNPISLA